MRQPFLGADQRHELRGRVEPVPKAPVHVIARRAAERRVPLLEPVLAVGGILDGGLERLDRHPRRRRIVVPRPEVNHVPAFRDEAPLDGGQLGERVSGKGGEPRAG